MGEFCAQSSKPRLRLKAMPSYRRAEEGAELPVRQSSAASASGHLLDDCSASPFSTGLCSSAVIIVTQPTDDILLSAFTTHSLPASLFLEQSKIEASNDGRNSQLSFSLGYSSPYSCLPLAT